MSRSVDAKSRSLSSRAPLMVKFDPGKVWNAAVISASVAKLRAQARRERKMTGRLWNANDGSNHGAGGGGGFGFKEFCRPIIVYRGDAAGVGIDKIESGVVGDSSEDRARIQQIADLQAPAVNGRAASIG